MVYGAGTYPSAAYSPAATGFTRRGWSGKTSSAWISEAKRSSPATWAQNSGFSPARSRASTRRRRWSSHTASPNIPSSRPTASGPTRSYNGTIVSMSPVERNG